MPVIALADIFGIDGRREELLALFRETEASARVVPGVRRYVFAVSPSDRDRYLLVSEWETQPSGATSSGSASCSRARARCPCTP